MKMPGPTDILLVEDEPAILSLLERVLARAGFAVRACASPAEALADAPVDYGLAIVDFSLPGMDGLALIGELRRRQPDLRVILCSGMPMNTPDLSPPVAFLQKPYSLRQLTELVAETLEPAT